MTIRIAENVDVPALTVLAREIVDYYHALDAYYKPPYKLENF